MVTLVDKTNQPQHFIDLEQQTHVTVQFSNWAAILQGVNQSLPPFMLRFYYLQHSVSKATKKVNIILASQRRSVLRRYSRRILGARPASGTCHFSSHSLARTQLPGHNRKAGKCIWAICSGKKRKWIWWASNRLGYNSSLGKTKGQLIRFQIIFRNSIWMDMPQE